MATISLLWAQVPYEKRINRLRSGRWLFGVPVACLGLLAGTTIARLHRSSDPNYNRLAVLKVSVDELAPKDAMSLGEPRAPNVAIAFIDVRCGICMVLTPEIIDLVKKRNGHRLIIRHFSPHPDRDSLQLGTLLEAIHEQGYLLSYLRALQRAPPKAIEEYFVIARRIVPKPIVLTERARDRVVRDYRASRALGLRATPMYVYVDADCSRSVVGAWGAWMLLQ